MARQKWEYMYLHVAVDGDSHTIQVCGIDGAKPQRKFQDKSVVEILCDFGAHGWELVCSLGRDNDMLVLKRPVL